MPSQGRGGVSLLTEAAAAAAAGEAGDAATQPREQHRRHVHWAQVGLARGARTCGGAAGRWGAQQGVRGGAAGRRRASSIDRLPKPRPLRQPGMVHPPRLVYHLLVCRDDFRPAVSEALERGPTPNISATPPQRL
eukprot:365910-Chlamydomonas_euryale.AAC.26